MIQKMPTHDALPIEQDRLRVRVTPDARKSALLKIEDSVAFLAIAAPPEDGKANAEVERFLTKLAKRKATITRGFTSKEKTVVFS